MQNNPFEYEFYDLVNKADKIRKNLWGEKAFFVKNMHINYSNICASHCKFCAFAKDEGDAGAYEMSIDDVLSYISEYAENLHEVHVVGSLHPDYPFSYYTDMLSAIKSSYPHITIKGFSAVEIDYFSMISGLSIAEVLKALQKSGLELMPGGGAEIFDEKVRAEICPEKISSDRWLDIHRIAHKEGIRTNATMLYGHIESDRERFDHLLRLRKLQEETGGFVSFIPLSFHPDGTFLSHVPKSTGIDDIRVIAASRIILDNIPHIKAYWVMLGSKTAQVALRAGADDLDGTIIKENITYAAGAKSEDSMLESELVNLIKSANMIPVMRDSFYKELKVWQI